MDHFQDSEFACPDCGLFFPNSELRDKLNRARDLLGGPIVINSGTRCPVHNAAVGGRPNSAHLSGEAADCYCTSDSMRFALLKIFFFLGFKRIEVRDTWLHVDVSKTLPQDVVFLK